MKRREQLVAPDVYAVTLATFEFRWVAIEGVAVGALGALASLADPTP